MLLIRILALLLIGITFTGMVMAEVPQFIGYQGRLTDDFGEPVDDGDYSILCRIYNAETDGTVLWTSGMLNVSVESGIFSLSLGPLPDSLFSENTDLWLGVQISSDPELTPRTKLGSVPYAYHSLRADTADVSLTAVPDDDWSGAGTGKMYATDINDDIGIGTMTPSAKLQVEETSDDGPEIWLMNRKVGIEGDKHGILMFRGVNGESYGRNVGAIWTENASNPTTLLNWKARMSLGLRYRPTSSNNNPPLDNPILSLLSGDYSSQFHGRVGILTTTPSYELDVNGTARMTGFVMPSGSGDGYVLTSNANGVGSWQPAQSGGGDISGSGTTNYVTKFTGSKTIGNSAIYEIAGHVGIGVSTPTYELDIAGDIGIDEYIRHNDDPSYNYIRFTASQQLVQTGVNRFYLNSDEIVFNSNLEDVDFKVKGDTEDNALYVRGVDGYIGIGTSSPSQRLTVNGTAKMSGFEMNSGAVSGYVLTSDATGIGTWQPSMNGSGATNYIAKFTSGTTLSNSQIYESGGNVSIGITDAQGNRLRVYGDAAVDGNLASNSYSYTASEIRYYSLAPSDFTPATPDLSDILYRYDEVVVQGTSNVQFFAPIHLPHGALIKEVCLWYSDGALLWDFVELDHSSGTSTVLNDRGVGCSSASWTVDNINHSYQIWTWSHNNGDVLYGGRVKYEISTPLP